MGQRKQFAHFNRMVGTGEKQLFCYVAMNWWRQIDLGFSLISDTMKIYPMKFIRINFQVYVNPESFSNQKFQYQNIFRTS